MTTNLTFAPPPWVTALLVRPPPPPATQPRAPPSAMRDLVAQWLVHVTEEDREKEYSPHVLARFRGWLAFVFRLPAFVRRRKTSVSNQMQQLPTPQLTLIERSLYFSSALKNDDATPKPDQPPTPKRKKAKKKRNKIVKQEDTSQTINFSPLYKSLYFSEKEGQSIPSKCESPAVRDGSRDRRCVQSFFLTDANGEGKGILDGLREMKAQGSEPQRKRGWVPAVLSLILMVLNPLK